MTVFAEGEQHPHDDSPAGRDLTPTVHDFPFGSLLRIDRAALPMDWRLAVPCPRCGAKVGTPCVRPVGSRHYNPAHYARLQDIGALAQRAVAEALTLKPEGP